MEGDLLNASIDVLLVSALLLEITNAMGLVDAARAHEVDQRSTSLSPALHYSKIRTRTTALGHFSPLPHRNSAGSFTSINGHSGGLEVTKPNS